MTTTSSSKNFNVEFYMKVLSESSNRTRNIIYIIIITSVLIFIPYWNVRPDNWIDSRITIRQNIKKYYGWDMAVRNSLISSDEKMYFDNAKAAANLLGIDTAHKFLDAEKEMVATRMDKEIEKLRFEKIQKSFISIPVFNIVVDINDLGLLGGFAFIVILFMLRASLWRELFNLKMIFKEAEDHDELPYTFRIMSMGQVLTVPPTIIKKGKLLWSYTSNIYLFLPLFVQIYSFVDMAVTFQYAHLQNPGGANFQMLSGLISLIIIAFQTYTCLRLFHSYNQEWNKRSKQIILGNS